MERIDNQNRILLADDEKGIRDSLGQYLVRADYEVQLAHDGYEALERLEVENFFLVLTDIMMPKFNGLELLAFVRENCHDTDVIMITGNIDLEYAIQALRHGAYDYCQKPLNFDKMLITIERVKEQQRLKRAEREMNTLKAAAYETVFGFVQAVEEKDKETKGHSERVATMTEALGRALGLSDEQIDNCRYAGLLHDIGKIGIPEDILNKPSSLTDGEFSLMRSHPVMGARILEPITFLKDVASAIRSHHENWDGTGYPDGLKGKEIPLIGRLIRISDVYDGLVMDRPYRGPVPIEKVIAYLRANSGILFDPDLAQLFVERILPHLADSAAKV